MSRISRVLVIGATLVILASLATAAEFQLEPTQNPDAQYRLFNTQNVYTLLELDTRTGQVWQVQWGDNLHRFVEPINEKPLVISGKPERFTLYATSNVFTFILLDQETGDAWYVQWGKPKDRFAVHID